MDVAEPGIRDERDLPLPVRREMREIDLDALEGRITEAERDWLVDELFRLLGIPPARADD